MDDRALQLLIAYVQHNSVSPKELCNLIRDVNNTIKSLSVTGPQPPVPVEDTVTDEYLICLEDGKQVTLLKRYLQSHFNMTPEQYREKWGLPEDYPMVAKNYSEHRSKIAKEHGLGKGAA